MGLFGLHLPKKIDNAFSAVGHGVNPFDNGQGWTAQRPAPRPQGQQQDLASRVMNQVNPFDNGRTFNNPTPTNNRSIIGQATHNGLTNAVGDFVVKPIVINPAQVVAETGRMIAADATGNVAAQQASQARQATNLKASIPGQIGNIGLNTAKIIQNTPQAIMADIHGFQGKMPTPAEQGALNRGLTAFQQTPFGQITSPVQKVIANNVPGARETIEQSGFDTKKGWGQAGIDTVLGELSGVGLVKGTGGVAKGGKVVVKNNTIPLDEAGGVRVPKVSDIITPAQAEPKGKVVISPAKNGVLQEVKRGMSDQDQVILDELRNIDKNSPVPKGQLSRVDNFMYNSNMQRGSNSVANNLLETSPNVQAAIGGLSKSDAKAFSEYANARTELASAKLKDKAVPGKVRVSQPMSELKAKVQAGHEQFGERFTALNQHYKELAQVAHDAGIIDKDTLNHYVKNDNYIRLQRDMGDLLPSPHGKGNSYQLGSTTMKQRRIGSNRAALDAGDVMAERTQQIHREAAKNRTGTQLVDSLEQHGLARKLIDSKDVKFRQEVWKFLADTREGKKYTEKLLQNRSKQLRSIQSELNVLNKEGVAESLRKSAPSEAPNIGSRIRVVKVYGLKQGVESLKTRGKWNVEEPIPAPTARTSLTSSKWINGLTHKTTPALKSFAKNNKLTEDEALVRISMKKQGADAYMFKGKDVVLNDSKVRSEVKNLVGKGTAEGNIQSASARQTRMTNQVVKNTIDRLFATDSSKLNAIRKKIANRDPKAAQLIDEVTNLRGDSEAFRTARKQAYDSAMARRDTVTKNKNTVSIFRNGAKEVYEVSPAIKEAMDNISPYHMNIVMRMLAAPGRTLRAGVTGLNPVFIARNLVKDQFGSAINSKHMLATHNPKTFFQGLFNATADAAGASKNPIYQDFLKHYGDRTSYDLTRNVKDTKAVVNRIRGGKMVGVGQTLKHPVRALENVAAITEKSTRFQNYVGEYRKAINQGLTKEAASQKAALAAWQNSVDFARAGTWGRTINTVIPYWNPATQGVRQMGRTFKDHPVKSVFAGTTLVGLPLVASTAWNISNPDTQKIWDNIPEYEKDNNIILIPPGTKQNQDGSYDVIKVPLPPGYKDVFMPLRRAFEAFHRDKPQEATKMGQDLLQAISGPVQTQTKDQFKSSFLPQAVKPLMQQDSNKDYFTGKEIVPGYINEATDANGNPIPESKKAYPHNSGTAQIIGNLTNKSPIKVEKFIKDTAGTVGLNVLNAADTALASKGVIPKDNVGGQSIPGGFKKSFASTQGIVNENRSEGAKYFEQVKQAQKGLNVNEVSAFNALHPTTKNFLGDKIYEHDAVYDPAARLDIYNRFPKVFQADKQLDQQNRSKGKPGNPLFTLESWQVKKVLEKENLPPGATDPELSNLRKEDWYAGYSADKSKFFTQLSDQAKKAGKPFGTQDNPYPATSPDLQKVMDGYNSLPKGTGARSSWIKANPGQWKAMQDQFAAIDNWQNVARGKRGLDYTEGDVGAAAGYQTGGSTGYSRFGGGSAKGRVKVFTPGNYTKKYTVGGGNVTKGFKGGTSKATVKVKSKAPSTGKVSVKTAKIRLA